MNSKEVLESATRQIRDHFQETAARWIDEMVPFATAQAGLGSQGLRRRITVRESVLNTRLNATTKRLDDGTFTVELNAGLTLLANRLADLFVAHLGFMGPTGKPIEGGVINEVEFHDELRELLATYWSNDRLYRPFHFELDRRQSFTSNHSDYAALLFEGTHRFVIGHELGHLILMTTKKEVPAYSKLVQVATANRSKIPEEALPLFDSYARRWAEELTCDRLGLTLTGDYFRATQRLGMTQVFNSAELLLITLGLLESSIKLSEREAALNSHPPASERLRILRIWVSQMPPHVHQMGRGFEQAAFHFIATEEARR